MNQRLLLIFVSIFALFFASCADEDYEYDAYATLICEGKISFEGVKFVSRGVSGYVFSGSINQVLDVPPEQQECTRQIIVEYTAPDNKTFACNPRAFTVDLRQRNHLYYWSFCSDPLREVAVVLTLGLTRS